MTFDEQVAKLLELEEKATKGPWIWIDGEYTSLGCINGEYSVCEFGGGQNWDEWKGVEPDEADRELICLSRNIAPELGRRYKRMREALEKISKYDADKTTFDGSLDSILDIQVIAYQALADIGKG
jgi:hypothetical protein